MSKKLLFLGKLSSFKPIQCKKANYTYFNLIGTFNHFKPSTVIVKAYLLILYKVIMVKTAKAVYLFIPVLKMRIAQSLHS